MEIKRNYDFQAINYIFLFILFLSLNAVIGIIVGLVDPSFFKFYVFDAIVGIIDGYLLVLFIKSYESFYLQIKTIFSTFLATTSLLLILVTLFPDVTNFLNDLTNSISLMVFNLTIPIYYFYILAVVLQSTHKIKKQSSHYQQKYLNIFMVFAVIVFGLVTLVVSLGFVLFSEGTVLPQTDFVYAWMNILPVLLFCIALMLFHVSYSNHSTPAIFLPQIVERLLIITPEGLPIYDTTILDNDISEALLSGAIIAIRAVLNEATQINDELKSITLGEYDLIIRVNEKAMIVVFTRQPTTYLHQIIPKILAEVTALDGDLFSAENQEKIDEIVKTLLLI